MKNKKLIILVAILVLISSLPTLIGIFNSNTSLVYGGLVFNPIDGYSYLAKMQIGKSGDWLFTLPYTYEPGDGRWLFTFYVSLGHLFHLVGFALPVGFNVARILSYTLLIFLLAKLVERVFPSESGLKTRSTFVLAAGGGLGWLLLPTGNFGADFWVAEAFPFLSGLANPHFPLGLCLTVTAILLTTGSTHFTNMMSLFLNGLILSFLSPFGFVIAAMILGLSWFWEKIEKQSKSIWPVLSFIFSGIPYCAYQFWAVNSTLQLAAWTAQNLTPSPQIWDTFLTFSPWLILILLGWKTIFQARSNSIVRSLIVWLVVGLFLSITPFSLQRRFFFGLSIPVTCLGMFALPAVADKLRVSLKRISTVCTMLVLPTPIFLVIMVVSAIAVHNPLYYFHTDELEALQWLSRKEDGRSLVLAGDQLGTMIPVVSRLRVVYGHPFETIQADKEKQELLNFFAGINDATREKEYLESRKVEWIFYGEREKAIGQPVILQGKEPVYRFEDVDIFSVSELLP